MKPPTLAEWTAWAATAARSWTDDPTGTHTAGRRQADAHASDAQTARPARTQHRPRRQETT